MGADAIRNLLDDFFIRVTLIIIIISSSLKFDNLVEWSVKKKLVYSLVIITLPLPI